jgi:hypothetical protein
VDDRKLFEDAMNADYTGLYGYEYGEDITDSFVGDPELNKKECDKYV